MTTTKKTGTQTAYAFSSQSLFADRDRHTLYLLAKREGEEASDKQGLRLFIGFAGKKMRDLPVIESQIERSPYGKATYKTAEGTFETSWIIIKGNKIKVALWLSNRSILHNLDLNDYNVRVNAQGTVRVAPKKVRDATA